MRLGLGLGIVKSAASIYKGILDKFPNAVAAYSTRKLKTSYPTTLPADYGAAAAYSLRKVKSDYEGSAVKVRRSSDGGLQDIGFVGNELNTTALLAFVNASGNAYASDFTSGNEDMVEVGGTGADGQSIADVSDAYKFTQDSSTGIHRAANPTNTNIVGGNISVSFDYYLPSGQTANRILFRTSDAGDAQVDLTTTDAWTTYTTTFSGIAGDSFLFYSAIIGQGLSFTGNGSDHFYLKNIVVTQTDADGHVTKWYDQSGNDNDATNTTDSEQPLVVSAGSVVTENGKAAIKGDGGDDFLSLSTGLNLSSGYSIFQVVQVPSANSYGMTINSSDTSNFSRTMIFNDLYRFAAAGTNYDNYSTSGNKGAQYLWSSIVDGSGNLDTNRNGSAYGSTITSVTGTFELDIIGTNIGVNSFEYFQELIVFNSDQSINRKDIEWNINNHYSIYEQWDRKSCMNVRRSSDNATQDIGFLGKNINQTQLESFVNDASPVLDDYTGAAAAYSLRKLRTAYGGSAIKVRRSSDDTEQDIGFDANGDLDTTALLAFVNADVNLFTSDYSSGGVAEPGGGTFTETINETKEGKTECLKAVWDGTSPAQLFKFNFLPTEQGVTFDVSAEFYLEGFTSVKMGANSNFGDLNTTTNEWATYTQTITSDGINDDFTVWSFGGTSGSTIWLKNIVITQTTADGAVTTFYDQSGNGNNATNATASEQPLVVSGGTLVTDTDGDASIYNFVDGSLVTGVIPSYDQINSQDYSLFIVAEIDSSSTKGMLLGDNATGGNFMYAATQGDSNTAISSNYTNINSFIDGATFAPTTRGDVYSGMHTDAPILVSAFYDTQTTFGLASNYPRILGYSSGTSFMAENKIKEWILFDSDQSANRLSIEGNIGRYYNLTGYRDGFVTKWYDQSGEYNHAENSTSDEQPQIVSNGSMLKENGKAAIDFDGVDDGMQTAAINTSFTNVSSFVVKKNEAVTGNRSVIRMRPNGVAGTVEGFSHEQIGGGAAYNPNTLFDANGNAIGNPSGQGASVVVQELSTLLFEQSQILAYRDGSLDQTINNVVSGTVPIGTCSVNQPLWIGYNFDSNDRAFDGKFQEIILFTSDQSSNREDIEKNINTHFKIYS